MGKIKNMLIDVETTLKDCLDNHGMTNQQALKHIENKFGSMGREHADATLKESLKVLKICLVIPIQRNVVTL